MNEAHIVNLQGQQCHNKSAELHCSPDSDMLNHLLLAWPAMGSLPLQTIRSSTFCRVLMMVAPKHLPLG